MTLLGYTRSIVLSRTRLATVEDDAVLVRLVHLLYYVARLASLCSAIGRGQRVAVGVPIDAPVGAFGEVGYRADQEGGQHDNVQSIELCHGAVRWLAESQRQVEGQR